MILTMIHPGHGMPIAHFHPSDAMLVILIALVAIALVAMTAGGDDGK